MASGQLTKDLPWCQDWGSFAENTAGQREEVISEHTQSKGKKEFKQETPYRSESHYPPHLGCSRASRDRWHKMGEKADPPL